VSAQIRRVLQRIGASALETQFKLATDAWIFRAPTPWLFGCRQHYLVSEAQKADIEMRVGAGCLVALALMIGSILLLTRTFVIPCLLLIGILRYLYDCVALRSLLSDAPQTTERITFADRLRAKGAMFSLVGLTAVLLGCFFWLYSLLYLAFTDGEFWKAPAGVILLASLPCALFVFFGAILWAKLSAPPSNNA